jgi:hypothetical protein
MGFSDFLALEILDHIVGGGSRNYTAPATLYVKLHTGDPGEACTANASSETDRKAITSNTEWGTAALVGGVPKVTTTTGADCTWPAWDQGAQTISHISIWDDVAAGNPLLFGPLTTPRSLSDGDTATLAAGDLSATLD